MKYQMKVVYQFEAVDDVDARLKARVIASECNAVVFQLNDEDGEVLREVCEPTVKFQKLFDAAPPRKLNL